MHSPNDFERFITRRHFFRRSSLGIGTAAQASLLNERLFASTLDPNFKTHGVLPALHAAPKAKRVIFLFMVGGPSQMDLFDRKPELEKWAGKPLPEGTGRPKSVVVRPSESTSCEICSPWPI